MSPDAWTVLVAVVAIVVSGATAVRQIRLGLQLNRIEEERRSEELERRRSAHVVIEGVTAAPTADRKFGGSAVAIRNIGEAIARDVRLTANDKDALRDEFPVPFLDPQTTYYASVVLHVGSPYPVAVTIEWEDDRGHHSHDRRLTFPPEAR